VADAMIKASLPPSLVVFLEGVVAHLHQVDAREDEGRRAPHPYAGAPFFTTFLRYLYDFPRPVW
jgi:hypothetical protein